MLSRVRVATLQYFIRPVTTFQQFKDQVEGLVYTARDYGVKLLVFPEYFTVQLLTLGDTSLPLKQQVRNLAQRGDAFRECLAKLAKDTGMYIVGGTIPVVEDNQLYNDSCFFGPNGDIGVQGKIHLTRWEAEEWHVSSRSKMHVFNTELGKIAVAICYDVEFPELVRAAARQGCYILVVPSCTDDRQGFLRVRYCAQARAIENQMYVIHSCTVGSLPMVPAVSLNYGMASILTPSDFPFARDGILAEGNINSEMMVVGELNLDTIHESRKNGTVLPLRDSESTSAVLAKLETVDL